MKKYYKYRNKINVKKEGKKVVTKKVKTHNLINRMNLTLLKRSLKYIKLSN